MASLLQLLDSSLPVPNYSTLCRRQCSAHLNLQRIQTQGPLHLLVDSTGLKVFGEGEWKVRQHGKEKRRSWRKLHLAIDACTQEIVAASLTDNATHDAETFPKLLLEIQGDITKVTADGVYDTWECRYAISTRQAQAIIPPRANARITECEEITEAVERDQAIRHIQNKGEAHWKESSGYSKRSLVETAMFPSQIDFRREDESTRDSKPNCGSHSQEPCVE